MPNWRYFEWALPVVTKGIYFIGAWYVLEHLHFGSSTLVVPTFGLLYTEIQRLELNQTSKRIRSSAEFRAYQEQIDVFRGSSPDQRREKTKKLRDLAKSVPGLWANMAEHFILGSVTFLCLYKLLLAVKI